MEFLNTLSQFDVIGRIDDLLGRARKGGRSHRFYIDTRCGMAGIDIERYLKRYGVKVFGRGFRGQDLYFSVGPKIARWVEYLLYRHGLPVTSAPIDSEQAAGALALYEQGEPLPTPWADDALPADADEGWRDAAHKTEETETRRGPEQRRKKKRGDAMDRVLGVLDRF